MGNSLKQNVHQGLSHSYQIPIQKKLKNNEENTLNNNSQQYNKNDSKIQQFIEFKKEYPKLCLIKNQQQIKISYEFLKNLEKSYEEHEYSIPNISFHYSLDGSQAILFKIHCKKEILQIAINQSDQFDEFYYDLQNMNIFLKSIKNDGDNNNNIFHRINRQIENNELIINWQKKYPHLTKIFQNKKQFDYEQLNYFTTTYRVHDYSQPDISFHYNLDGSQAILFNLFCEKQIVNKAINQREDFNSLFYDVETMHILIQKERNTFSEDFDAIFQQYDNNSIPLSTYLSMKFEDSKKCLNNLGVYKKKNLNQIATIPNPRLRQDLIEIYECLDQDLEFDDSYQDQYCFAYFTQSDNPFLLEGLIVGPEDTPYEGIIYTLTIKVPHNYPNTPPYIYFNQTVLHPNISEQGKICLDILNNKWSPALTIQKVLISIVSLLYEKNLDDVYNHYAKCLYYQDPLEYKKQILQQSIYSGCKKVDINYNELSKLSTEPKRKNILQSNENEFEDEFDE